MSASPNRAILLASLLMLSVAPISGIASAEITRGSGNAQYNVSESSGNVTDGAVIFQGEDDITIVDSDGNSVSPARFQRAAEAGGETISLPVAQDAATGTYEAIGLGEDLSVVVDSPRITTFDINNNNGEDVSGGILGADQNATVNIEFNFADSERINLTIEDSNGVDVTNELTSANTTINASVANNVPEVDNTAGSVTIPIDLSNVDVAEYTFTVEGDEDLAFGEATQSTTVRIAGDTPTSVRFNNTSVPTDSATVTVNNAQLGNKLPPQTNSSWSFIKPMMGRSLGT